MKQGWVLAAAVALGGCFQLDYLVQAAYGQDEIGYGAQPIEEVIADVATPERTRRLLALIGDVKRYGEAQGLKPTANYEEFVDLNRSAAVWVVSASQPLRFESLQWTFPIVGSVPYLGWFDRREAEEQAAELRRRGYDADVREAAAYSTLGGFGDPIVSTMLPPRDSEVGDLVNVVLHESVHATHYVASQSLFNESLADFVAGELTPHYLRERLHLDRWQLLAYRQAQIHRARLAERFHEVYQALEAVYASEASDADKLARKKQLLTELQQAYGFRKPLTNATLAQSRNYAGGSPVFAELLERCGGDWGRFWRVIQRVDGDSFKQPQEKDLAGVMGGAGCSS